MTIQRENAPESQCNTLIGVNRLFSCKHVVHATELTVGASAAVADRAAVVAWTAGDHYSLLDDVS